MTLKPLFIPPPDPYEAALELARKLRDVDFHLGSYWGGELCLLAALTAEQQQIIQHALFAFADRKGGK